MDTDDMPAEERDEAWKAILPRLPKWQKDFIFPTTNPAVKAAIEAEIAKRDEELAHMSKRLKADLIIDEVAIWKSLPAKKPL